jgi:hypothetical protein
MSTETETTDAAPEADGGAENYDQILAQLEGERDTWRSRAEIAETNLEAAVARADAAETALKAAQTNAGPPQQDPAVDDSTDAENGPEGDSGRDGRYRERLRDAEAARDGLQTQLEALRAGLIDDRLASTELPREIFETAGHAAADFFAEDGRLDSGRLDAAIAQTRERYSIGVAKPRQPLPDPSLGRGGGPPAPTSSRQTWDAAFGGSSG